MRNRAKCGTTDRFERLKERVSVSRAIKLFRQKAFDKAEEAGAVLYFDEADALFGKRSEVKDSHDRFANMEIRYLLQRIESYPGTVIFATNMKGNIDPAFTRRLRYVVEFPPSRKK